jgi:hypothetical protein
MYSPSAHDFFVVAKTSKKFVRYTHISRATYQQRVKLINNRIVSRYGHSKIR